MKNKAVQRFDEVQKFADKYCKLEAIKKLGTWIDEPCWYVSIALFSDNAGTIERFGVLLGPFRYEDECREYAYDSSEDGGTEKHKELQELCEKLDSKSVFYAFGMVKMKNGYRSGTINKHYPEIDSRGTLRI